jgi:hypothetical protein
MIIQNELTINNATEIYNMFAKELQTEEDLHISIIETTPVDVTFIQIVHSFLAKCKSMNKKIFFEIKGQPEFIANLKRAGYFNFTELQLSSENELKGGE